MKSLLTKIAIRKAVGLYLSEHDVTVSKVVVTPLGHLEIASSSQPYTTEDLAKVLESLLVPLLGRKRRVPVAVGLAGSRIFFGTRLTPTSGEIAPEAELQKALCSTNLCADDLVVDLLRGNVNKLSVARMAACRKKYMAHLVAVLSQLGVRPYRAEPAPCALVRAAEQRHRIPRRSKAVLRVFLGSGQGLAVAIAGGLPVNWRAFPLTAGTEGFAILSAARSLRTQQSHYGIESALDFVIIHGRVDLHERLQKEQIPTELGTRVLWYEGPALGGAAFAHGLALGCLAQDVRAFDLSRSLKSRPSIKEIFPWADLAFTSVLVACMGLVLGAHSMQLREAYATMQAENSRYACLGSTNADRLGKDKKALQERVDAVRTFLDSRLLWSSYTQDIAARLPADAVLSAFEGTNVLGIGKKKGTGGVLQISGRAPLAKGGAIPREIDAFLNAIPKDSPWKRDFTTVVTDIKLPLGNKKLVSEVDFSITGVRKSKAPSASPKGDPEGKKEKK